MNSLSNQWDALLLKLQNEVDEDIDLKGILFLIGVQELQKGIKSFTKEEKQDLLHIATCRLLSSYGYFKFNKIDEDGWPHWIELKPIKNLTGKQQDLLIKEAILTYFD